MYSVGEKIIYGENGVCTVTLIAPLDVDGSSKEKLYYHLRPLIGSGMYFSPIDSSTFTRPVMSRSEAEALIDLIPSIAPAICSDTRFNHVDQFYKELFRLHTPEALVAIIKGLTIRTAEKKTKSAKSEASIKRAKEMLYGELSVALDMDFNRTEKYIMEKVGEM